MESRCTTSTSLFKLRAHGQLAYGARGIVFDPLVQAHCVKHVHASQTAALLLGFKALDTYAAFLVLARQHVVDLTSRDVLVWVSLALGAARSAGAHVKGAARGASRSMGTVEVDAAALWARRGAGTASSHGAAAAASRVGKVGVVDVAHAANNEDGARASVAYRATAAAGGVGRVGRLEAVDAVHVGSVGGARALRVMTQKKFDCCQF